LAGGIAINNVGIGDIENPALASFNSDSYAALEALTSAPVLSDPDSPIVPNAVNLYFVGINDDLAYGSSMGIPGMHGTAKEVGSGVIIAVEPHRVGELGLIDFDNFWKTVGHESGHWLGLNHTTEQDGSLSDKIADTPECPASADVNGDGMIDRAECAAFDGEYLMFWEGVGDQVSPQQSLVLRSSPLAQ
jgi:hypothetical protein